MSAPPKTTVVIITGASRGFGRSTAVALSKYMGSAAQYVLVARSDDGLKETAELMQAARTAGGAAAAVLAIETVKADLSDLETLPEAMEQIFAAANKEPAAAAMLVNNAASVGDLSKTVEQIGADIGMMKAYFDFNVVACMALTSRFLAVFKDTSRTVINVSSLLAVQAFPGWGLYAPAKAARDMLHQVVSKEDPTVRTLNYAPGPLDTDMQKEVRDTLYDEESRTIYKGMHAEGKLVSPDTSADKLAALITKDAYDNGAHVDFYDL
eukprot:gene15377-9455_t